MDREEALDRLYAVPLAEFTTTRNELAKELGGGEGVRIKALKKPNLAAWAINQLARGRPDDIAQLFDATNKLRTVQRRVLSGGKASELRKATDERSKFVGALTKLAGKILRDAGHAATAPTLAAIRDSFVAVASDEEGAARMRKGQLERELEVGAFVDVGGLTLVPASRDDDDGSEVDATAVQEARTKLGKLNGALRDARDVLKTATAEANRLRGEADEAERRAKGAREAADFSQRAADARKGDVESAEAKVKEAQAAVRAAEKD